MRHSAREGNKSGPVAGSPRPLGGAEPVPGPGAVRGPGSWRLRLDGTLCDGHGICAVSCPELISLDIWGYADIDASPLDEGSRSLARARRAVAACPEEALSLVACGPLPTPPVRAPLTGPQGHGTVG